MLRNFSTIYIKHTLFLQNCNFSNWCRMKERQLERFIGKDLDLVGFTLTLNCRISEWSVERCITTRGSFLPFSEQSPWQTLIWIFQILTISLFLSPSESIIGERAPGSAQVAYLCAGNTCGPGQGCPPLSPPARARRLTSDTHSPAAA